MDYHQNTLGASQKEDVQFVAGALDSVTNLRPVSWHWKDKRAGQGMQYGFIAQEVEKVFPAMVSEGVWIDGKKHKFIAQYDLIPYMVAAIKEQQVLIDNLRQSYIETQ